MFKKTSLIVGAMMAAVLPFNSPAVAANPVAKAAVAPMSARKRKKKLAEILGGNFWEHPRQFWDGRSRWPRKAMRAAKKRRRINARLSKRAGGAR